LIYRHAKYKSQKKKIRVKRQLLYKCRINKLLVHDKNESESDLNKILEIKYVVSVSG